MSSPPADRAVMSPPVIVLLLTLLLGIQPITTDLYLPALPTISRELGASAGTTQLTLSVLIICFGLAQLVCGPLADRFGRRPVLFIGMVIYTAASVLSAFAPAIEWLIVWRALQGAAMAAAVTCGRSIVRDLFPPHEGAKVMSRALTGLGVIATLSPITGGLAVQWIDWQAALLVLGVFGAVTLAFIAWRFEETVPKRNPRALQPATLWRNWAAVLANPSFRAWALLSALTYSGLFIYLAGSSFVFANVLGVSRASYGLLMASNSFAYIVGTLACRHLLASRGLRRTVRLGGGFSLAGGLLLAGLAFAGVRNVWAIVVPMWIFAIGHGIHQPCGQAGAVGPFPDKAGAAAAMSGFTMTLAAFIVGLWLGRSNDGTVYPLTLGIATMAVGTALVAWTLVQRHGEPLPAGPVLAA